MTDFSENGESPVSSAEQSGEELVKAVEEAVSDWIADESIAVEREGDDIVADEEVLVENISIMVAIAVYEVTK